MNGSRLITRAVLLAAASTFAVSSASAQEFAGETLVVGVWGGDIERLIREHVVGPLEAETGATVELLLGGTGDRVAKIYAERENPTMDIAFLNIFEAPQALADGVVVAPDEAAPYYADIWDGMNNGCYAMSLVGLGIAYNTALVPEPPEWEDMWDEAYAGQIALPQFPGSEANGILAIAARLEGSDERSPDVAFAKLAELAPVALTYTNLDEIFGLMEAGEVAMAPMISGYVLAAMQNYEDIAFVFPTDPGPLLVRDMLCVVANSPQPELAERFVELALSVETQTAYADELYFGPTNMNVELSPEISELVIDTPEEVESLVQLDWPYVMENRSGWTDRWNREILGQ